MIVQDRFAGIMARCAGKELRDAANAVGYYDELPTYATREQAQQALRLAAEFADDLCARGFASALMADFAYAEHELAQIGYVRSH